jgi:hypothetical protein
MRIGIFGNNRDRIPDVAFRVMSCILALRDRFSSQKSFARLPCDRHPFNE